MIKYYFKNAFFVKTACFKEEYPKFGDHKKSLDEIATIGRSNVGKSTLLNHLFRSKNLVKTSSTPGKTQALNFFTLNDQLVFVDLPGYGFSKAPLSIKKRWANMIETYLSSRKSLKLLLFLFDIRRIPSKEDIAMYEWILANKIPAIMVLTKVDKIKNSIKKHNTDKIIKAFDLPYVHYSAKKNEGRDQLISLIHKELRKCEKIS